MTMMVSAVSTADYKINSTTDVTCANKSVVIANTTERFRTTYHIQGECISMLPHITNAFIIDSQFVFLKPSAVSTVVKTLFINNAPNFMLPSLQPFLYSKNLEGLGITNCTNVVDIGLRTLSELTGLTELIISNTSIYKLDHGDTLTNNIALENINFANNKIEYVNPVFFIKNRFLKVLNLSYNPIKINENVFLIQNNLETLYIDGIGLRHLPMQFFVGMPQLKQVSMVNNNFKIHAFNFLFNVHIRNVTISQ